MKLLNCIISYNRFHYLKNLIDSIDEFFPYGDTIVIDDQSDNVNITKYLQELKAKGIHVFNTTVEKTGLLHGGLYHAMDMGMEYATNNGYDYINFLQDDLQCMWYDVNFENIIVSIFSYSEKILSVCPVFMKGIHRYQLNTRLEVIHEIDAYYLKPYAITDISIISTERFRKLNIRFTDKGNENYLNELLNNKDFMTMVPKTPLFAWIPWPKTIRYGSKTGSEKPPKKKYYYRPISTKGLKRLKNRDLFNFPVTEDYCHTWGYFAIKPYWFTDFKFTEYCKYFKKNAKAKVITLLYPYREWFPKYKN